MPAARHRRLVTVALAGLSAGAGAAHVSVVADHAAVAWWYGAGFAIVAFGQLTWAAALLLRAPSRRLLGSGALGHAVVLGTWVLARTVGLPFVPGDSPSAVGLLDGTTALFQGLIVVGVLATAGAHGGLRPRLERAVGVSAVAVLLLTAPLTVAALTLGPAHTHDPGQTHGAEPADAAQPAHADHDDTAHRH